MHRWALMLSIAMFAVGCGGNPYLEQSLKPAAQRHETKEWFEKEWGKPSGTSRSGSGEGKAGPITGSPEGQTGSWAGSTLTSVRFS